MTFKKKKNPEIEKAEAERDVAMTHMKKAVEKVDELKDELLRQYEEADAKRRD